MSVLVVGLSHRSAPVELLERAALPDEAAVKVLADAAAADHVAEVLVVATCNRVEIYADVVKFHGGVQELTDCLVRRTGIAFEELTDHLYVHYEDRAVQHLFEVAAGLDSMVIGEQQVLGQLRRAVQLAREEGTLGRALGPLAESALRAGKRAHAETGIDRAGRSLAARGLDHAAGLLGGIEGRAAVVVGAGAMGSLVASLLRRHGVGSLVVVNRTAEAALRVAAAAGGRAATPADLAAELADADLLVTCTGAAGTVITPDHVASAAGARTRPLVVLDLALPRDVDPAVRAVPGVAVTDLADLGGGADDELAPEIAAARRLVGEEVAEHLTRLRGEQVAPTVTALRARAQEVVDRELARLGARLPGLDERAAREISSTLNRVVDKLLHAPTVRAKELAGSPGGDSYAALLRELFALDPAVTEAVARADVVVEDGAP